MDNREIIKGIQKTSIFDFVANHYWEMSKEQLKAVCMEIDYAASQVASKSEYNEMVSRAVESLEEIWED